MRIFCPRVSADLPRDVRGLRVGHLDPQPRLGRPGLLATFSLFSRDTSFTKYTSIRREGPTSDFSAYTPMTGDV